MHELHLNMSTSETIKPDLTESRTAQNLTRRGSRPSCELIATMFTTHSAASVTLFTVRDCAFLIGRISLVQKSHFEAYCYEIAEFHKSVTTKSNLINSIVHSISILDFDAW